MVVMGMETLKCLLGNVLPAGEIIRVNVGDIIVAYYSLVDEMPPLRYLYAANFRGYLNNVLNAFIRMLGRIASRFCYSSCSQRSNARYSSCPYSCLLYCCSKLN